MIEMNAMSPTESRNTPDFKVTTAINGCANREGKNLREYGKKKRAPSLISRPVPSRKVDRNNLSSVGKVSLRKPLHTNHE